MIQQTGNSLPFDFFFTASKVGKTGLTVTVDVYNPAGTKIVTDGSASEIAGGLYTYSLASGLVTTAGNYRAVGKTSDATVDVQQLPALWTVGEAWVQSLPAVAPGASGGLPTTDGTKLNQTVNLVSGQSIAVNDKTGFSLSATGADLILKSSTFIQAIVAAVNEFATYGLTALNTLLVTTGIKVATNTDKTGYTASVSDKTGFSLSTSSILAIWNQLFGDGGIVSNSFGAKLRDWALGTDHKSLISTDAQDLSTTLHVDGKTLNGATPNNLAAGAKMDIQDVPNPTAVTAIQNGLSKPGTAQTITPPADMALNSTVAKDSTVMKSAGYTAPNNPILGSDNKVLISTNAQDLSSTLNVNSKTVTDKSGYSLTSDYNPSKNAAPVGAKMDIKDVPNPTAITAIQNGLATPTNITAGTITTVTNLTNAPSNGDFTSTMKSSITAAVPDTTSIVTAVLGGIIEGTLTIQQSLRIFLAMLSGKASGGGTVSQIFRNTLDTKNRITFTTDANGNRTSVTFDLT